MRNIEAPLVPAEFWKRLSARMASQFPGFRSERAVAPPGRRAPSGPPSLVGPAAGRLWELSFLEPRLFSPEMQVGITTSVRLIDPPAMPHYRMPWLYAGIRPRVFSRGSVGTDRILERYRQGRGSAKGTRTGDADLDRRWVVYTYDAGMAAVYREAEVHRFLRAAAALSPHPERDLPTLAVYGTEATLTLPTTSEPERVAGIVAAFEGCSHVLDRLEASRGMPPASTQPILMDLLHDDAGIPFPLPRFECPWCHRMTHPRFHPNFNTEVCEKCGQALYQWK
ncbi:MAG TPA: hypothetical protein VEL82_05940 [Thermoplasmata archaeon]|nr:hypothetical protein [Thermoplasmata archaeon]